MTKMMPERKHCRVNLADVLQSIQYPMQQQPVRTAIAILRRVNKHVCKCHGARNNDGIKQIRTFVTGIEHPG